MGYLFVKKISHISWIIELCVQLHTFTKTMKLFCAELWESFDMMEVEIFSNQKPDACNHFYVEKSSISNSMWIIVWNNVFFEEAAQFDLSNQLWVDRQTENMAAKN